MQCSMLWLSCLSDAMQHALLDSLQHALLDSMQHALLDSRQHALLDSLQHVYLMQCSMLRLTHPNMLCLMQCSMLCLSHYRIALVGPRQHALCDSLQHAVKLLAHLYLHDATQDNQLKTQNPPASLQLSSWYPSHSFNRCTCQGASTNLTSNFTSRVTKDTLLDEFALK